MSKVKEPWEKVQDTCDRGKGVCWVQADNGWVGHSLPTVCGLMRRRMLVRVKFREEVTCPVCVQWLKANR